MSYTTIKYELITEKKKNIFTFCTSMSQLFKPNLYILPGIYKNYSEEHVLQKC